ncbi:hypothetical protein SDC9_109469 [bioreactor metagenome]|uniref:Uncharacterized protein n=1 Tax=bioreactor metagenome TaxID=1076179 RepID=A0A645BHA9_9ZZZZ
MARAVFAHPVAAGHIALDLCADGLKDGLDERPGRGRAAGHHARPLQRAFLAAGNAGADIEKSLAFNQRRAADGVRKVTVAAVDDYIARFKDGEQFFNVLVHRLPGLDHEHDLARRAQRVLEFFQRAAADDIVLFSAAFHKLIHLFRRAVVHRNGEPLRLHVHDQVFAHHGEPDQTDIRFFHLFTLAFPL